MPTKRGYSVRIYRDNFGIPHIYANTEEELAYGLGYAIAEDRLGQLERVRRATEGRLSNIHGPDYVNADLFMRGITGGMESFKRSFDAFDAEDKAYMQAFSEGINRYLSEIDVKVLEKKHSLSYKPGSWSSLDLVATSTFNFHQPILLAILEVQRVLVYKYLESKFPGKGEGMTEDLMWLDDPDAFTTIPSEEKDDEKRRLRTHRVRKLQPQIVDLYKSLSQKVLEDFVKATVEISQKWTKAIAKQGVKQSGPAYSGSEAELNMESIGWVVSGKKSVTGLPMIYISPGLREIWYHNVRPGTQ